MKIQKSLLAVIAMAGTMGFSAVASAMDFSVYGSLRGGINQADTDNSTPSVAGNQAAAIKAAIAAGGVVADATTVSSAGVDAIPAAPGVNAVTANPIVVATDADTTAEAAKRAANLKLLNAAWAKLYSGGTPGADVEAINANEIIEGNEVEAADAQLELGHGFAGSRIGVRGSEDLGNGAEAGLHWEVNVGGAGETASGRHANVWYSGAFGKVTIGQQGNPYRSAANWDQSWWIGGNNRYSDGGSRLQGVRYDGDAGAFNFSVMATANKDTGNAAKARSFTISADSLAGAAGNTGAVSQQVVYDEVESETGIDSWIATGHYDMGVATINLGYRTDNNEAQEVGKAFDNFVISANGSLDALDWYVAFENNTDNANVKLGTATALTTAAGATDPQIASDAKARANVQQVADHLTTAHDTTTIGLFLGYNLSDVSTLYFEWEDSSSDGLDLAGDNLDKTSTLLGFSRSIGPNTSFIAEYVTIDNGSEADADSNRFLGFLKVDF